MELLSSSSDLALPRAIPPSAGMAKRRAKESQPVDGFGPEDCDEERVNLGGEGEEKCDILETTGLNVFQQWNEIAE